LLDPFNNTARLNVSGLQSRDTTRVLAFEGGGLSSMASFTGLLVGIVAASGDKMAGAFEEKLENLFRDFSIISSCSGGSWFAQELQYSADFVSLLNEMTQNPNTVKDLFSKELMLKRLKPEVPSQPSSEIWAKCQKSYQPKSQWGRQGKLTTNVTQHGFSINRSDIKLLGNGKVQVMINNEPIVLPPDVALVLLLLSTYSYDGPTWESYVELMYRTTGSIEPARTIGGQSNSWARGKLGVWGGILPSPGPGNKNMGQVMPDGSLDYFPVYEGSTTTGGFAGVSYSIKTDEGLMEGKWPFYTPVKFSAKIGVAGTSAPLSFCAFDDCFGYYAEYYGQEDSNYFSAKSPLLSEVFQAAFTNPSSSLSISKVGAVSSAAQGNHVAEDNAGSSHATYSKNDCLRVAVWAGKQENGRAFDEGSDLLGEISRAQSISQDLVSNLASQGLHALADCGPVDITGVAQAVAAAHQSGAEHVTVVGFQLTQNYIGNYETATSQFLNYGADPADASTWDNNFIIFKEPTRDAGNEIPEMVFERLFSKKALSCIYSVDIGTLESATTVENNWFGIKGDKTVKYHLIVANIQEDCQAYSVIRQHNTDWNIYGQVAQDIVDLLGDNKERVSMLVGDIFR